MELIEASNYHQTRRHYALSLDRERNSAGRSGHSLCSSESMPTWVHNQAYHESIVETWSSSHPVKDIASLPLCKRCEKKAAKLTDPA